MKRQENSKKMRPDFLKYQAQTSPHPLGLEISKAKGCYIYDTDNKRYLDFVAGVSANTLGHGHPNIVSAVKKQAGKYMHVMVYGEFVQEAPLKLCKILADHLPKTLNCVYLTNSGTEATEGALKLAKRVTGRHEIIAAHNAYHGNTQGAMSVCGKEEQNRAFRPLIPGTEFIEFNNLADLNRITNKTAAVILETIQGGAGLIEPVNDYFVQVKKKCEQMGALFILDEIQTGIGRTGKLFGFENYGVVPDIVITGKGLGGGMPIGAFISSHKHMNLLKDHPKLGHITTFGGHPVIAAAGLATIETLLNSSLMEASLEKEQLIRKLLVHESICEIRGRGLMLALILKNKELTDKVILGALQEGLVLFWLLFEPRAVRITPPLTITESEIKKGCRIILSLLNKYA